MGTKFDPEDILGEKFHMLYVYEYVGKNEKGKHIYKCLCDCGKDVEVPRHMLIGNKKKSCNCLKSGHKRKKTVWKGAYAYAKKEGLESELSSWRNMINRCTNPNHDNWKNYGGKNITVCKRWMEPGTRGFKNFMLDMGRKQTRFQQIDRKHRDESYHPGNCRWLTRQQNNRHRAVENYLDAYYRLEELMPVLIESGEIYEFELDDE